jgi:hypothetical protein
MYRDVSKNAVTWTQLFCHGFAANAVRPQLHALAYNLANFLRTLALPPEIAQWSRGASSLAVRQMLRISARLGLSGCRGRPDAGLWAQVLALTAIVGQSAGLQPSSR